MRRKPCCPCESPKLPVTSPIALLPKEASSQNPFRHPLASPTPTFITAYNNPPNECLDWQTRGVHMRYPPRVTQHRPRGEFRMRIRSFLVSFAILPLIADWSADAQAQDRAAVLETLPYSNA